MERPETFWAYLAGILDGEGHISLYQAKNKKCTSGYRWSYTVCITNTNKQLIESIQSDLELGHMTERKQKNPNHHSLFRIDFTRKDLDIIFPKVLPYLRAKKERAALLLEAFNYLSKGNRAEVNDIALRVILAKMPKLRSKIDAKDNN
jgi:hypothetical protein